MSEELIREIALAIGGPEDDGMDGHYWELDLASARALLPIIRRRELEAGEKVKEATLSVHVPFGGRESYDGGVEDYEKAIRALDVAVIIGASHD